MKFQQFDDNYFGSSTAKQFHAKNRFYIIKTSDQYKSVTDSRLRILLKDGAVNDRSC